MNVDIEPSSFPSCELSYLDNSDNFIMGILILNDNLRIKGLDEGEMLIGIIGWYIG